MKKRVMKRSNTIRLAAVLMSVLLTVGMIPSAAVRADDAAETDSAQENIREESEKDLLFDDELPAEEASEETESSWEEETAAGEDSKAGETEDIFLLEETDEQTEEEILPETEEDGTADAALLGETDESDEEAEEETDDSEEISESDPLNGKYTAFYEEGEKDKTVRYEYTLILQNGKYTYAVRTVAESMDYDDTEITKGEYAVTEDGVILFLEISKNDSDESEDEGLFLSGSAQTLNTDRLEMAETADDGALLITGTLSAFQKTNQSLTFEKQAYISGDDSDEEEEDEDEDDDPLDDVDVGTEDENGLKSGKYSLTEDSYDESAAVKPVLDIILDVDTGDFYLRDETGADKGSGTFYFDEELGRYVMTYNEEDEEEDDETEDKTTEFIIPRLDEIEFISPLYVGNGMINPTDSRGNFLTYVAVYAGRADDSDDSEEDAGVDYQFTAGANGSFVYGQSKSYTLRVADRNGGGDEYEKFESLEIDGEELLEDEEYEASEGSVILVISPDYMKNLNVGLHEIKVYFSDGTAATNLTVTRTAATTTATATATPRTTSSASGSSTPKTADTASALPYSLLMGAACAVIAVMIAKRKRSS